MIRLLACLVALSCAGVAEAATWTVDPTKSRIGFSGTQTGQSFSGQFSSYTAKIAFDPARHAGDALIVIKTCSAHTGDVQRDQAMPGADWFNCAVLPDATFAASSFSARGPGKYAAQGRLTIRGVSRPVTLPFSFTQSGKTALVDGALTLTRTDYGVGQNAWASGQWVGLAVTVTIHLTATSS